MSNLTRPTVDVLLNTLSKDDFGMYFDTAGKKHLVLKKLGFEKYYKGTFPKDFQSLSSLMENVKYIVDMSVIKHDGGGSQYTFLEAIYQQCVLIINKKWIENQKTNFVDKKNCFVVADENDLVSILQKDPPVKSVLAEAKKLLEPHLRVNWIRELSYIK